jgi:hypothetical protein
MVARESATFSQLRLPTMLLSSRFSDEPGELCRSVPHSFLPLREEVLDPLNQSLDVTSITTFPIFCPVST